MKKVIFLLLIITTTTGCAKLFKLPQLLTLKRMADSQAAISKEIEMQDEKFDLLVAAVKDGSVNEYTLKKTFIAKFGEPILVKTEISDGEEIEKGLYRYQTKYLNTDKVYVYFDKEGKIANLEYIPVE